MRLVVCTLFLIASAVPAAFADRIVLIYGDVLEGRVVQETETAVTIQGPFGEQKFSKTDIKEIVRDSPTSAPAPAQTDPAPQPSVEASAPNQPAAPSPYEILKRNVEIQSSWKDLEIAYLQRAYLDQQTIQTQFIGRVIPPNYFRSKLTTPIPASAQFPQGGEIEYDMYRAKSTLYQAVKSPGQPIQYLKLDMRRIDGLNPGDNPVESFKAGFVGAGTDETLLSAVAAGTRIIGTENTDGHDCWVLETINTPQLVEAQVSRQPLEAQAGLRQQLSQLGYIRSWVGREDTIQWRMENYDSQGNLLLSMKMITVQPNQGLSVQDLRMKVPKGTEFIDVTDMVAGQFDRLVGGPPGIVPIPGPNELMGSGAAPAQPYVGGQVAPGVPTFPQQAVPPGAWPPAPQSYAPQQQAPPQYPPPPPRSDLPQAYPQQPGFQPGQPPGYIQQTPQFPNMPVTAPQSPPMGYPSNPPGYPVPPQAQVYQQPQIQYQQPQIQYQQPQVQYPQPGQAFQQTYVQQQPGFQQPQPQRSGVGGFLGRIFGGGGKTGGGPPPMIGGYNQSGNATMMVPMMGGQPQFPAPQQ